ncbi:hypothetical protein BO70DRAFT_428108 [Aspergillus heteromorphus CBS 117.55]|uniref:Uncharacterized protein n=1 Tax=Aspergillus heteromorphus CBS 117.55 TaxID=1448321 RepID=A0A317WI17_9EURO|nr:uncharacterized protein BO70DRAFT_428108 [Aspergillus heteromorphus CBS 117.55]PWY86033.1 hypothetical protein BO70DRAFT_428108 [Aspergillus heteromorphus CBS 117.55]
MSSNQQQQQQQQQQQPRVIMDAHLRRPGPAARQQLPPAGAVRDIRQTKEYKAAARRWLSTIVALPILMYTSWMLYERTYGDKKPKRFVGRGEREGGNEN